MSRIKSKPIFVLASFVLTISTSGQQVRLAFGQPPNKTAEEVYKNIQVLKGAPAQLVLPTMNYFETALGVGCDFCHDEHQRELDDKETKQTTRKMIRMVFAINNDFYGGGHQITCFTCHRGNLMPVGLPLLSGQELQSSSDDASSKEVDQIIDKYLAAIGGADAIRNISSRAMKGSVTDALGRKFPLEIYSQPPAKRILTVTRLMSSISTAGAKSHQEADYLMNGEMNGATVSGFNGDVGWIAFRGNHPDTMRMHELDAARLEDPLFFSGQLKQVFNKLHFERIEIVDHHDTYVVSGAFGSLPHVTLYFDKESGMLVRLVFNTETLVGQFPTQIDYSDFRIVNGVKLPFRWTISLIRGRRFIYQIDQAQQNIPIDESKFAKPDTPIPSR